ncbi:MAG: hypothetical protein V1806_08915 [Pseudomonadota bacterium]
MELNCYLSTDREMASKVAATLKVLEDKAVVEVHSTLGALEDKLRRQTLGETRCLLAAATARELQDILGLSELLQGVPLILVLPDGEPATVSGGHRLRPRLLTNPGASYFQEMIISILLVWTSSHQP